jgi:hypothetical protein
MIGIDDIDGLKGTTVVDADGHKLGTVGHVFLSDDDLPHWVSLHTGLFGIRESLAPLDGAELEGEVVRLSVTRAVVKEAPHIHPEHHLWPSEEAALYQHYGLTPVEGARLRKHGAADDELTADEERPEELPRVAVAPPPPDQPLFISEGVMLHPDEEDYVRRAQIDFDGEVGRDRV